MVDATPPEIRGFHWTLSMRPPETSQHEAELPRDEGPIGLARPPLVRPQAHTLGRARSRRRPASSE